MRYTFFMEYTHIQAGIVASVLAGLSTSLGALFLFLTPTLSPRLISGLLGFGGGVMLSASSFSLILPALETFAHGSSDLAGLSVVLVGITLGALVIFSLDILLPHEHIFKGREGVPRSALSRAWLFVLAIAIHNFPEGLSVGVGYGTEQLSTGHVITMGIILQNLPEGLIAAVALMAVGYSRWLAFGVSLLTGLVETCGGLIGLMAVQLGKILVPFGLSFAAGAMVYVVCHEVIPESFRRGFERTATTGLMIGFVIMLALNQLFA